MQAPPASSDIPAPVTQAPVLAPPQPQAPLETYSVVVNEVPIKEMLFALARDADLNIDIDPAVSGTVTLNAIDQTLPQMLDRISRQTGVRFKRDRELLIVEPDTPYLMAYQIDYVNMSRDNTSSVSVATQIATTGGSAVDDGSQSGGNNNSTTQVVSTSNHRFWETLQTNIQAILGDGGGSETAVSNNVIANPESGVLSVRATQREHRRIRTFIDQVMTNAKRQVLIEATVVEVTLSDDYQLGVDWSRLTDGVNGLTYNQSLLGSNLTESPFTLLNYTDPDSELGDINATVRALKTFGDVQVLSSPKIMAINNQTALLKVVDNLVYFTVEADTTTGESVVTSTFTSTVHTVPVGFVMSVTPAIDDSRVVTLNVRPTISRVTGFVNDPNPSLANADVVSRVPEVQVREMDSVLRIPTGQVAVLGGLIQDSINRQSRGVPWLSDLPQVGEAFRYRNNQIEKTELVIFLRPRVVNNPSITQDFADYQRYLPANLKSGEARGFDRGVSLQ
ncbi:MAG TPA: pilus (MSHA type) biogenesis protein MshL [Arenicellales bacterium]|nr:pilus (MSHA type) biogenesis protein MshL [Arenicellales bacterium]